MVGCRMTQTTPPGTVCLACNQAPAVTTNNGTTVPLCAGCNKLRSAPRGVKMTGNPKKKRRSV